MWLGGNVTFLPWLRIFVPAKTAENQNLRRDVGPEPPWTGKLRLWGQIGKTKMSYEKRAPGCLRYLAEYTTQLDRDYNKPL